MADSEVLSFVMLLISCDLDGLRKIILTVKNQVYLSMIKRLDFICPFYLANRGLPGKWLLNGIPVSYTHLTLPTNREV